MPRPILDPLIRPSSLAALARVETALHTQILLKKAAYRTHAEAEERMDERRLASLIQNTTDVIAVTSPDATLRMVSRTATRAWGRCPRGLKGDSLYRFVHPSDRTRLSEAIDAALGGVSDATVEIRILGGSDVYRAFQTVVADLTADPDIQGLLLTFHDLSERKAFAREMTYHAFHDRLTDLANRDFFMDRLSGRLPMVRKDDACAVILVDLDNFKLVNDGLGHAAGDELLVAVAERLRHVGRPIDTVARVGGDEFAVLLDSVTFESASSYAQRLKNALLAPFPVAGREVFVTASVGIALCDRPCRQGAEALQDAETAMHRAKSVGKGEHALFDPGMNEPAIERLELESDLRQALERDEFFLHYQPIVSLDTGEIKNLEALLRWRHPTRGLVSPLKFVEIAEETGLIHEIGRWALAESCHQLARWQSEGVAGKDLRVSVNVSGRQLHRPDFVPQVEEALRASGLDPRGLTLEVTETAAIEDVDQARVVLGRLREIGVRIAIDDFGTGYSSISYLCSLPVDSLKIDRSFVASLGGDKVSGDLVQAIVGMAKALGLQVVCEGIETSEQLAALRAYGGDSGQGYLFGRPQPASLIERRLIPRASDREWRKAA